MSERKIRPGLSIDPELWSRFKERYQNASHKVEELMRETLDPPKIDSDYFSCEEVSQFVFNNASDWSLKYDNTCLNITNSNSTNSSDTVYKVIKIE